eukprot:m.49009 g.49009  ORF g.49009 m.49009 type:complete len:796 (-) comp7429_c0_seq1:335-2722(-)
MEAQTLLSEVVGRWKEGNVQPNDIETLAGRIGDLDIDVLQTSKIVEEAVALFSSSDYCDNEEILAAIFSLLKSVVNFGECGATYVASTCGDWSDIIFSLPTVNVRNGLTSLVFSLCSYDTVAKNILSKYSTSLFEAMLLSSQKNIVLKTLSIFQPTPSVPILNFLISTMLSFESEESNFIITEYLLHIASLPNAPVDDFLTSGFLLVVLKIIQGDFSPSDLVTVSVAILLAKQSQKFFDCLASGNTIEILLARLYGDDQLHVAVIDLLLLFSAKSSTKLQSRVIKTPCAFFLAMEKTHRQAPADAKQKVKLLLSNCVVGKDNAHKWFSLLHKQDMDELWAYPLAIVTSMIDSSDLLPHLSSLEDALNVANKSESDDDDAAEENDDKGDDEQVDDTSGIEASLVACVHCGINSLFADPEIRLDEEAKDLVGFFKNKDNMLNPSIIVCALGFTMFDREAAKIVQSSGIIESIIANKRDVDAFVLSQLIVGMSFYFDLASSSWSDLIAMVWKDMKSESNVIKELKFAFDINTYIRQQENSPAVVDLPKFSSFLVNEAEQEKSGCVEAFMVSENVTFTMFPMNESAMLFGDVDRCVHALMHSNVVFILSSMDNMRSPLSRAMSNLAVFCNRPISVLKSETETTCAWLKDIADVSPVFDLTSDAMGVYADIVEAVRNPIPLSKKLCLIETMDFVDNNCEDEKVLESNVELGWNTSVSRVASSSSPAAKHVVQTVVQQVDATSLIETCMGEFSSLMVKQQQSVDAQTKELEAKISALEEKAAHFSGVIQTGLDILLGQEDE